MKKIVIIRGMVTAGKTTTSYELAKVLPDWIFIDDWKIKEMFEPLGLKDRTNLKKIAKSSMIHIMKQVINNMGNNIIVQETSKSFIMNSLKRELNKHNYRVYSFFLEVEDKDVGKRDIQREKPTRGIKKEIERGNWKNNRAVIEKGDFVINTSKNSINKVIDIILKEIKEKRKEHLLAHLIRKSL